MLAGTPQQPGLYNITVKATDGDGCSYSVGYQINVQCGTLDVGPTTLPELMLGTPYNAPLEGSAGVPPYSFAITSGILPAGISLVGSTLMGTPTLLGTASSFIVTVTDANACTGTRLYMPTIGCPLSSLEPPTLPAGEVGELYRGFIQTFGGREPYTYEAIGQLPPGVTFMPTGSVIGTPTEPGAYSFTISSTDGGGCVTMQDYTIEITGGRGGGCSSAGADGQQTIPIALLVIGLARRRRRR